MRNISDLDIQKRLAAENPWWEGKEKFPKFYGEMTPRPYINLFFPLLENRSVRRAVVLMGPRRVGKTVMLHHSIQKLIDNGIDPKHICYVSVDHPLFTGMGLEQMLEIYRAASGVDYRTTDCYVIFDEIQYLKDWERHLKVLVDSFPSVKCAVSGSAAAALKLKSTESGAGRFTDFLLPPLTFYEYLLLSGKEWLIEDENSIISYISDNIESLNNQFINYLNYGGYPEALFSEDIKEDPGRFIKSDIIDKVLLRDLPSLYGIHDIQELNALFSMLAYNTGSEVSLEGLSKKSNVSKNTLKKNIEYLESAFLIKRVHRIDDNARRFKRATTFKVYLTNPSMRSALFSPVSPDDEAMGPLVETAIFSQLFHSPELDLYHYARWKKGEIDIVKLNRELKVEWANEIKWSDKYVQDTRPLDHIIGFCHKHNLSQTCITTRSLSKQITHEKNVKIIFEPASLHCCLQGKFIILGKQQGFFTP